MTSNPARTPDWTMDAPKTEAASLATAVREGLKAALILLDIDGKEQPYSSGYDATHDAYNDVWQAAQSAEALERLLIRTPTADPSGAEEMRAIIRQLVKSAGGEDTLAVLPDSHLLELVWAEDPDDGNAELDEEDRSHYITAGQLKRAIPRPSTGGTDGKSDPLAVKVPDVEYDPNDWHDCLRELALVEQQTTGSTKLARRVDRLVRDALRASRATTEARVGELERERDALAVALSPFARAGMLFEFYVDEVMPEPTFPVPGTRLDPEGPDSITLRRSRFVDAHRAWKGWFEMRPLPDPPSIPTPPARGGRDG